MTGHLWTFEIDIDTGETHLTHEQGPDYHDYPTYDSEEAAHEDRQDGAGYATFDQYWHKVYAESTVSAEHAAALVYLKCKELRDKFTWCCRKLTREDE